MSTKLFKVTNIKEKMPPIDPEKYLCECGLSFKRKDHLTTHKKALHDKSKVKCEHCNKFFHPLSLGRHMKEKCGL